MGATNLNMVDITSFAIVCGLILIVLYCIKYKEMPHLEAALVLIIGGESMVFGLSLIAYTLTENTIFLIDSRVTLIFGGYALMWLGFNAYDKYFKDIQYEIPKILKKNNGKMSVIDLTKILCEKHLLTYKNGNELPEILSILEVRKIIKLNKESKPSTVELFTSKTWADEYGSK